jgi:hypothetical protein
VTIPRVKEFIQLKISQLNSEIKEHNNTMELFSSETGLWRDARNKKGRCETAIAAYQDCLALLNEVV